LGFYCWGFGISGRWKGVLQIIFKEMSNSIIQVRDLSKSYTISHEGRERYTALRDVMAQKAKKIFSFPGWKIKTVVTKEEFWALKDINFEIEQGDRVGIIGRNGAGKSTLLKILSRITEPTTGQIKIKGRVASLLEVGTGFHPELTGRENIFLNGAILGMSRTEIKKHFDAIVDFAEVEKFLDTPVKRYSSGMYVRLAFAVAAHLEPEILVIDEVLAVGDIEFQKKCLGKMEDVSNNEGRTVIFVSHNMSAISSLCKKGILLKQGKITSFGNIADTINLYIDENNKKESNNLNTTVSNLKWWIRDIYLMQNESRTNNIDMLSAVFFHIDFEGRQSRKISFEILIKDSNYNPVLFIPLGLGQNINFDCDPGKYSLDFNLSLPHLAMGKYHMDIYIVESFIERISNYFNIYSFDVISSYIPETGWSFERSNDLGNIMGEISDCRISKAE
jgi:lipopolysaccharide transport system ATP-binding protein